MHITGKTSPSGRQKKTARLLNGLRRGEEAAEEEISPIEAQKIVEIWQDQILAAITPARPNPLLSYIVKIVRNISMNIYYRKEAAKRSSRYTVAMEEIENCLVAPNTVEAEIEARELACIIESFLDTLTVENRVIFMRRYWFADSGKDIAEFVGLTEKNIFVRLTRIRQKMKEYLAEREVFV